MDCYTLNWNATSKTVEATFHGMWTLADANNWRRDVAALLKTVPSGFTMIVDMTDHPPQSQEVKSIHDVSIGETLTKGPRKVICIVASTVLAMQMRRSVAANSGNAVFDFVTSKDEALRTLAA